MSAPGFAPSCMGEAECARQERFLQDWGCSTGFAQSLPLRTPPDLPPRIPADMSADMSADGSADGSTEEERALYAPYYLFGDARVAWLGWLSPRPRGWGAAAHLVGFSRSFSPVSETAGDVRLIIIWIDQLI